MRSSLSKRPNILFIQSDQHRFDCVGVNGAAVAKTPNMDALAADGLNFEQAYTPCPVCTPARASLLTGQWSYKHLSITLPGTTESPRAFLEDLPTFSQILRNAGYYLGYTGKWHVGFPDDRTPDPQALGFHEYVPEGDYYPWREQAGFPPSGIEGWWREEPWVTCLGWTDTGITADQSALHWMADHVIRMLHERVSGDQPFFIRWDPTAPHLPNIVPEPYASMYDPAEIEPWGSMQDPLEGKPYMQAQQRRTWRTENMTWNDWAPMVARYCGEITLLDHEIGRVLESLDRLGLAENTLVIYTTDHGDMCGSHGMFDKHYVMYDDIVHVPLIARWPGVIEPGSTYSGFVSHALDFASTFCDVTGCEIPSTFQGKSLLPAFRGEKSTGREDILSAYHGAQFGLYTQRMVRNREWKYVWNATAEDELYDLRHDPWEIHNRATDPACDGLLKQFRARLIQWMEETEDPILNVWTRAQLQDGVKV